MSELGLELRAPEGVGAQRGWGARSPVPERGPGCADSGRARQGACSARSSGRPTVPFPGTRGRSARHPRAGARSPGPSLPRRSQHHLHPETRPHAPLGCVTQNKRPASLGLGLASAPWDRGGGAWEMSGGEPALLEPPGGLPRPPGGFGTDPRRRGRPDAGASSPAPHAPSPGYPDLRRSIRAPSPARSRRAGHGGWGAGATRFAPAPAPAPRPRPGGLRDPSRGHLAAGAGGCLPPGSRAQPRRGVTAPARPRQKEGGLEAAAGTPALCPRRPLASSRAEERLGRQICEWQPPARGRRAGAESSGGCRQERAVPKRVA